LTDGTQQVDPAGSLSRAGGTLTPPRRAGGTDVFSSNSSIQDVLMAVRGGDVFSDSSEEDSAVVGGRDGLSDPGIQKAPAASSVIRGHNVFSDSDDAGRSIPKASASVILGRDVFSDSEDAGRSIPKASAASSVIRGQDVFSDSEDAGRSIPKASAASSVIRGQDVFSDSEDAAASSVIGGRDVFSDSSESESEEEGDEVLDSGAAAARLAVSDSVVSGRFTAASFQMPIPESWLTEGVSDTE
jgi:hypothetical protein